MATNFEKWKQGLKPKDLLRDDGKSCYNQSIFETCAMCPAHRFCDEWHEKFGDIADMVGLGSCENLFNEWANAEAKETNEHDRR